MSAGSGHDTRDAVIMIAAAWNQIAVVPDHQKGIFEL